MAKLNWKEMQDARFIKENKDIEKMLYGETALSERGKRADEAKKQLDGEAPSEDADFFMSTGGGTPIKKGERMAGDAVVSADEKTRKNARDQGKEARDKQPHDAETGQFMSYSDIERERKYPDRAKHDPKWVLGIVFEETEYGSEDGERTLSIDLTREQILQIAHTYKEKLGTVGSLEALRIVGKYHKDGTRKSDKQIEREKAAARAKGPRKYWGDTTVEEPQKKEQPTVEGAKTEETPKTEAPKQKIGAEEVANKFKSVGLNLTGDDIKEAQKEGRLRRNTKTDKWSYRNKPGKPLDDNSLKDAILEIRSKGMMHNGKNYTEEQIRKENAAGYVKFENGEYKIDDWIEEK